ncbi:dihydroorotase [Candidatus Pelagibacter communis]|uniref:dihydroorotase n=1 Tax=Pelagibacter ubique TaxID=198252 RepID=UPI00094D0006|nr:dihydroorotase [Candidatus Pelagibacter ubique]|tara:strand:- start:733 stop:2040 length:1308 start_codon:yes stop_codon:yes gene_type:complete
MLDIIIKNGQCYIDGKLEDKDIAVKDGKIFKIGKVSEDAKEVYDASSKIVLPGCIDTQTHFREPGSTDTEDLHSGSRAAVAGGITAVFEMPNTNPPTANLKEFQKKLDLAKNRMYCNYAFYFGATANNVSQLAELKDLEGCCGIKLFAGSSTGNLLVAEEKDIDKVFKNSSKVVAVHSEDEEILIKNKKLIKAGDVHSHPIWRSEECAMSSTRRIVRIAEKYNKKAHVLHVTTKQEIDFLSQHKGNITFEITPQHLTIYAPDCYNKLGTYAQMNPPLRDKSHYDRLWYAVKNNLNDTIGSDHAPHLKVNKEKEYPNSPSGMPGVQTLMPVMLNHVNAGRLSLTQLINLVCENPIKIFGIRNKGFIKEGYDADFTIVDMNKKIVIKNENIESKCGWSPFHGVEFKGTPVSTIIKGKMKMKDGKIIGEPEGTPLKFN